MKNIAKSLVIAGALASTGVASAAMDELNPYVGVDYKHTWIKAHNKKNQPLFKKNYPGANVYVGTKLHENVGLEVGYDFTKKQKKTDQASTNKVHFKGFGLDLNAYLPVDNCFEVIGTAGLSHKKAKVESTTAVKSNKSKLIARFGAGAQYMVADNVGLRGLVRWENTARFKSTTKEKLFKDAVALNLGVFYKF